MTASPLSRSFTMDMKLAFFSLTLLSCSAILFPKGREIAMSRMPRTITTKVSDQLYHSISPMEATACSASVRNVKLAVR